jgi:MoaA/NifB/PqqE/SkfB family radical SAM enzyme
MDLTFDDTGLAERFHKVRNFAKTIRSSEYHVTNACNIRCEGCWFYANEFEKRSKENKSMSDLDQFILAERERGVNAALLIGGEPTLFMNRIEKYVEHFPYVTISTNGLVRVPQQGMENIQVFISLFGGGPLDDSLRAIKPNGKRFTGLFETTLKNYKNDSRVTFVYALTEAGTDYIEDTVRAIEENGNKLSFNFYSEYGSESPLLMSESEKLLDKALEVKEKYPNTVLSTPYYIKAMITGQSHWGEFSYDSCPSISIDHPDHEERLKNGNRTLPLFNTYAPDLKTLNFCCTSGNCSGCRDSQAVFSWLLISADKFMDNQQHMREWVELSESYWKQHIWSPYNTDVQKPIKLTTLA